MCYRFITSNKTGAERPRDKEPIFREAENRTNVNGSTVQLVNSTEKDSFIRNSANSYWQTVCVYASRRYANNFSLLQQAIQVRRNSHFSLTN